METTLTWVHSDKKLLGAPGITTRSDRTLRRLLASLLGALLLLVRMESDSPRSKDATNGAPGRTTRSILTTSNKKLLGDPKAFLGPADTPWRRHPPLRCALTGGADVGQKRCRVESEVQNAEVVSTSFLLLLVRHLLLVA